jgi:hypothetical protein
MTNPFLKNEVHRVIEDIQTNIDRIERSLRIKQPRFLLLATFLHYQKDVRRIRKDGPRRNVDDTHTNRDGKRHTRKLSSYERGTTQDPHPTSQ